MRKGQIVHISVKNYLPFENLSLDLQTAQAIVGTDQAAGFLTAALPNLKGALTQTSQNREFVAALHINTIDGGGELPSITAYRAAYGNLASDLQTFLDNSATIYAQINEVISPISPSILPDGQRAAGSVVTGNVPRPWTPDEFPKWKGYLTCEIASEDCPPGASSPAVIGLLTTATKLSLRLGTCPSPQPTPPSDPIMACLAKRVKDDVGRLTPAEQAKFADFLKTLDYDAALFTADIAAITALIKDLSIYYANIKEAKPITPPDPLGEIPDPLNECRKQNEKLPKFLGRQVVFSVNAINEVSTLVTSVPGTSAKKSIATITVLYADPIFEASGGVFFSTLANRSFANQTLVTQNSGTPPTLGNVVIAQTVSRPTVVPFAGANWRLGPNFTWFDKRRGAAYLTTGVGLNVNNTMVEFAGGLSVSWRAVMFSGLYHWGHDVRLTQGEYVGQVWCNMSAASGSIPKCSGSPPAPSTERYWTGAFAFGVSVRVQSVFK
jgi:hypothetical protein